VCVKAYTLLDLAPEVKFKDVSIKLFSDATNEDDEMRWAGNLVICMLGSYDIGIWYVEGLTDWPEFSMTGDLCGMSLSKRESLRNARTNPELLLNSWCLFAGKCHPD